jgi:hypothetical protein
MKLFFESLQRNEISYIYLIECLGNDDFRAEFGCYGEYLFKAYKISDLAEMLKIEIWHFNWESQNLTKHRFYDENLHLIVPILSVAQDQLSFYILCSPVSDAYTKPISTYSYPKKIVPKLEKLLENLQDLKKNKGGIKDKEKKFSDNKKEDEENIEKPNQEFKVTPADLLDPEDFQCTLPFLPPPMNNTNFVGKNDGLDNFTQALKGEKLENFSPAPGTFCSSCGSGQILDIGLEKVCKCSLCIECFMKFSQMEKCPICQTETDPILLSSYLALIY